ncbi:Rid family hydrolase [Halomonas heilongjiangensis]|nr:Rid family hydrolase [Halomonas heilongjiangensis]
MSLALATDCWMTVCATAPERVPDVADQTRQVLDILDYYLEESGVSMDDGLLTAMVWLKDITDYAAMNDVWNDWIGERSAPVRCCLQANMARPEMLVEIKLIAAR